MLDSLHIDAAPVLGHFKALIALGVPRLLLEKTLGIKKEELERVDTKVPFISNIHMIEKGMELLGPDVPLKLGTHVSLEKLGVCGYLFQNGTSIQEVADQFVRYQKLLYAVSNFQIKNDKTTCRIEHSIKIPAYNYYERIAVELAFSSMITILRELVQQDFKPLRLELSFRKPNYVKSYREIFSSSLMFNQKNNAIVFSRKLMSTAIPGSQSYIKYIMEQHANYLLKEKKGWEGIKNEVIKIALELLPNSILNIEMVAEKLKMSRWTLTRKLKKEGLTFKDLINGLKKDMALNYLANDNLSITEIAFLLGYSEASAFHRAFKSWTGKTPRDYRLVHL
jgi:AraC-like DNA-binding protein